MGHNDSLSDCSTWGNLISIDDNSDDNKINIQTDETNSKSSSKFCVGLTPWENSYWMN